MGLFKREQAVRFTWLNVKLEMLWADLRHIIVVGNLYSTVAKDHEETGGPVYEYCAIRIGELEIERIWLDRVINETQAQIIQYQAVRNDETPAF